MATGFGWWRYHRSAELHELVLYDELRKETESYLEFEYRPAWARLILPFRWLYASAGLFPQRAVELRLTGERTGHFHLISELDTCEVSFGPENTRDDVDALLEELSKQTGLERLVFADVNLDDGDLTVLQSMPYLYWLEINGRTKLTDAGIRQLEGLRRLQFLAIGPCDATWTSVKQLQARRPGLNIWLHWFSE